MQLFKTFTEAEEFLENLETDLDRIDCLDYLILEIEEKTLASEAQVGEAEASLSPGWGFGGLKKN
jgi:hypothetical protein